MPLLLLSIILYGVGWRGGGFGVGVFLGLVGFFWTVRTALVPICTGVYIYVSVTSSAVVNKYIALRDTFL